MDAFTFFNCQWKLHSPPASYMFQFWRKVIISFIVSAVGNFQSFLYPYQSGYMHLAKMNIWVEGKKKYQGYIIEHGSSIFRIYWMLVAWFKKNWCGIYYEDIDKSTISFVFFSVFSLHLISGSPMLFFYAQAMVLITDKQGYSFSIPHGKTQRNVYFPF